MKQTQYAKIIQALRRAGNKGCTVRDLLAYSNCPWARIREMECMDWARPGLYFLKEEYQSWDHLLEIVRRERLHNGRKIRVYVLKRVK